MSSHSMHASHGPTMLESQDVGVKTDPILGQIGQLAGSSYKQVSLNRYAVPRGRMTSDINRCVPFERVHLPQLRHPNNLILHDTDPETPPQWVGDFGTAWCRGSGEEGGRRTEEYVGSV